MADVTREVGFRIVADSSDAVDAYQDTAKASKTAEKAVSKFGKNANKALAGIKKAGAKVGSMFKSIGSALLSLKGLVAGFVAFMAARGLVSFFRESIRLAQVQEQAIVELGATLASVGATDIQAATDSLAAFASELQRTTTFGDETILTMANLGLRLGVAQEDIEEATEAATNLAAGLNIDLRSAMLLVGKAAKGETSALSRYGLTLDENIPKTEKFAAVLELVNDQFGGAAQAQARTFSGALAQLSNTWGDLREQIGSVITANKTVRATIIQLNKFLGVQAGQLKDNREEASDLVSRGLVQVLDAMGTMVKVGAFVVNAFQGIVLAGRGVGLVLTGVFIGIIKTAELMMTPFTSIIDALVAMGAVDTNPLRDGLESVADSAIKAAEAMADDIVAGAEGMVQVKLAAEEAARDIGNFKRGVLETAKALEDEFSPKTGDAKTAVDELNGSMEKTLSLADMIQADLMASGDGALDFGNDAAAGGQKAKDGIMSAADALQVFREKQAAATLAMLENQKQIATSIATTVSDQMFTMIESVLSGQKTLAEAAGDMLKSLARTAAKAVVDVAIEAGIEALFASAMAGAKVAASSIGMAADVAAAEVAIGAAAATAQAQSLAAYAAIPFAGPALGAAQAATLVAAIQASRGLMLLARGGEITGGTPGKDSVPALLTPGERVLTVDENKDFKRFVGSMATGVSANENRSQVPQPQMVAAGGFGGQTVNVQFNSVVPADMTQRKRAFRQVDRELARNRARKPFSRVR